MLAALVVVGCYAPEVVPGSLCGEGGACPAELVCVAGRCELPGGVGDGAGELDAPVDAVRDAGIDAPKGCPASFFEVAPLPNRYLPRMGTRSYDAARADCAMLGGYLVVPNSMIEIQLVIKATSAAATWLGIDDIATEGTFIAADTLAPATFLPWQQGQPDNDTSAAPGGQDCVQLVAGIATFDDDFCTKPKASVCECTP